MIRYIQNKQIYAKVPYQVNMTALCKEFGVSHPTLNSYLNILGLFGLMVEQR